MKEVKEPEIKLFGRKIVLPESGGGESSGESSDESNSGSGGGDCDRFMEVSGGGEVERERDGDEKQQLQDEEDQVADQLCETKPHESDQNQDSAEFDEADPKTPSIDENSENTPKTETDQTVNGQQKPTLKKPDKILPCPRCNSMDTKFCYYNNYNVNQPRHFCKSCQRYWTAGGTMRNVPVGAGRRKNKNSASHCRHITISEALQVARVDPPNGYPFKPNGTVLSFSSDSPLCESMASSLNLANKRAPPNGVIRNGSKNGENGDECSSKSMNSASDGDKNVPQQPLMHHNMNGFPYPVPCIPGVPWSFPPAVPIPTIIPSGYPMPFYPTPPPYWNCPPLPNPWNLQWLSAPSPTQKASPPSPLGKHSRNGKLLNPNNGSEGKECNSETKDSESSIVVPKTLRIDDPEEAAKSSIWETLGIKYDSISREGLFKALQPKGAEKKVTVNASPVLQANPAALSRSISFQEVV